MLPAVPFPSLSKVSATKTPLAWEELELVRKKNSLVPVTHQAAGARACWSLLGHSSPQRGRDVARAQ